MCGYCIETAMLELLEKEISTGRPVGNDREIAPLLESFVQETNFLMHGLKLARECEMTDEIFYVLHCRAIEEIVNHPESAMKSSLSQMALIKHMHSYKKFISSRFNANDLNSLLPDPAWMALYQPEFVFSADVWTDFFSRDNLLAESTHLLDIYKRWWIRGGKQGESDLDSNFEETAVYGPNEDISNKDWEEFHNLYPAIYFALNFCARHSPELPVLRNIALAYFNAVPQFPGYDLWLSRKAFVLTINYYGIGFLLEKISDTLSLNRLYYSFLRLESVRNAKDLIIEKLRLVLDNDAPCGEFRDNADEYIVRMHKFRLHAHNQ